jgi:sugar/nucleoside kinase (ribokinase family)
VTPTTSRAPTVVVIGDVIDDVIVRPRTEVARGSDTPSTIVPSAGGSGANQAVWLAAAGSRVRFVGRVGAADVARHQRLLRDAGVDARLAADLDRHTGRIVIIVDRDGERSMFTDRGANLALRASDVPDDLLEGADVFHISGYSLFHPEVRAVVLDVATRARQATMPVTLDPGSSSFIGEIGADRFRGWLDGVTVLLPNLDEGRLLAGTDQPERIVTALLDLVPVVALTLGADGALVASRDERPIRVAGEPVTVADSTGAGDAFSAAFLTAWFSGRGLEAAAAAGVAAGGSAVQSLGGRPPGPPR